jgi:FAD/FMN-containing dehydrogenase
VKDLPQRGTGAPLPHLPSSYPRLPMTNPELSVTNLRNLASRIAGDVLLPSDEGYDEARAVWNGRFDPHPAAVVRCLTPGDVAGAIRFARSQNLPLSVRGGGHSYAGHGVHDGALTIDLSLMNGIEIDAGGKRAVVGPGATWGAFDAAAQEHGLATPGGTVSTVGVAGFTLGGGSGYLSRKFGMGLDNLLSAEVVVADGRVVRASESENADLFWAIRGGSGNFGVVTSFEFRLHEVGPEVVVGQAYHPIDRAREVLRFYRELTADAPAELMLYAFVLRVPPVEPFPAEFHGQPTIALVGCYAGDLEAGEAAFRPVEQHGQPILAAVQRVPYVQAQQAFDAGMPKGLRWYSMTHYIPELSDEAIETFAERAESLRGPFTLLYFGREDGAVARVDPSATAFPHRDGAYGLHIFPGWTDPAEDGEMRAWAREVHAAMAPYANGGAYVNLLPGDDPESAPAAAWCANLERLARVKAKWDPENLFRINHNVSPAGWAATG